MARNRPIQQGILGVTWLILIFVCRSGCNAPTIRSKHGRGKASGTPAGQFQQLTEDTDDYRQRVFEISLRPRQSNRLCRDNGGLLRPRWRGVEQRWFSHRTRRAEHDPRVSKDEELTDKRSTFSLWGGPFHTPRASCSSVTWVYFCVVERVESPRSSSMARRSA